MVDTKTKKDPWVFALYFLPGLLYLLINSLCAPTLAEAFGMDLWAMQMYILVIALFMPMLLITYFYLKFADKLSFKEIIAWLGFNRFSWKNMLWAVALGVPAILLNALVWTPYIAKPLQHFLSTIPLIQMPEWYWQNTMQVSLKTLPLSVKLVPFILLLIFNHLGEEIFFRGFLVQKTEPFAGKWTPVVAGLLFIAHHTFQIPVSYPLFPMAIFFAGFYYWKKDIYSMLFLHFLANLLTL